MRESNGPKRSSMYTEIMEQYGYAGRCIRTRWPEAREMNRILRSADTIVLLGTGASLNACYGVQHSVMKYLMKIPYVSEMAQVEYILPTFTDASVCLIVSQSGNSKETRDGIDLLKDSPTTTIAVTNSESSYLAEYADKTLLLQAGDEISSATKTCTMSMLLMCMAIAAHDETAAAEINTLPDCIGSTLDQLPPIVDGIAAEIKDCTAAYIGAAGALYAAARQGALLMKEKDFMLVEGLSLSELRHGTVEAVWEGMPVFLLAAGNYVAECTGHAEYFSSQVKANVFLITDVPRLDGESAPYTRISVASIANEAFSGVCFPIFFQLLSERIAGLNDYDIDGFRYLSKVIDRY